MYGALSSPQERFCAFVMRHIKSLGCEVFIGVPTSSPYRKDKTPYLTIAHTGIKEEGKRVPLLSDYSDSLNLLKYQIEKYCEGKKRIIIRRKPEIEKNKKGLYFSSVRLIADDGKKTMEIPFEKLIMYKN